MRGEKLTNLKLDQGQKLKTQIKSETKVLVKSDNKIIASGPGKMAQQLKTQASLQDTSS